MAFFESAWAVTSCLNGLFGSSFNTLFGHMGQATRLAFKADISFPEISDEASKIIQSAGATTVCVLTSILNAIKTIKEPMYTPAQKALIVTGTIAYATVSTLALIGTITGASLLGPIVAIPAGLAGALKYSSEIYGNLKKSKKLDHESEKINANISSVDRHINFVEKNMARVANLSELQSIKTEFLNLKGLDPEYEKWVEEHISPAFENLEKLYKEKNAANAGCRAGLNKAKGLDALLKGPNEDKDYNQLLEDITALEIPEKHGDPFVNKKFANLNLQKAKLQSALNQLTALDKSAPEYERSLRNVQNDITAARRSIRGDIAEFATNDNDIHFNRQVVEKLKTIKKSTGPLASIATKRIAQNKRDMWQNVGRLAVGLAITGLAIAAFFVPPIAIAVTVATVVTAVSFTANTVRKSLKKKNEDTVARSEFASARVGSVLDKSVFDDDLEMGLKSKHTLGADLLSSLKTVKSDFDPGSVSLPSVVDESASPINFQRELNAVSSNLSTSSSSEKEVQAEPTPRSTRISR